MSSPTAYVALSGPDRAMANRGAGPASGAATDQTGLPRCPRGSLKSEGPSPTFAELALFRGDATAESGVGVEFRLIP
jgi:hypothetical protein